MATNWVKFHALTIVSPQNSHISLDEAGLVARLQAMFNAERGYSADSVAAEVRRLFATGQIVVVAGAARLGRPIFEEACPVSDTAGAAADAILNNLAGRRDFKRALAVVDADVLEELKNTFAVLIDERFNTTPR